jgi:hypothetical protein
MNKKIKIIVIIIGVILLLTILSFIGIFSEINKNLNKWIAGTPDKSCNIDSDCVIKKTTCGPCDCGDVVNKNWKRFCPLPDLQMIQVHCADCEPIDFWDIKCIDNQCQRLPLNE